MITIISGTNRPGSRSRQVAAHYHQQLADKGLNVSLIDLAELPDDAFASSSDVHPELDRITEAQIRPATGLIFIAAEYNGSIPGVLKALIDHTDIKAWHHKKSCLVGVATGRAGNIRGLDHLANILLHCKGQVLHNKLPISSLHNFMNEEGIHHEGTLQAIDQQIEDFREFLK